MIAFPGKPVMAPGSLFGVVLIFGGLILCPGVSGAEARTTGPSPNPGDRRLENPGDVSPPRESKFGDVSLKVQNPGNAPPSVTEEPLAEITPDGAGVLTEKTGGFGPDLWAGAERAVVEALLPKLPVAAPSKAMRDLTRRLLMTLARPPKGPGGANALIVARAALLADMADVKGFAALMRAVPARQAIPALARIEAEHHFLNGDHARGCAAARKRMETGRDMFWEKASIFCQILDGKRDEARLGVSLLREMGDDDAVFHKLVDALTGAKDIALETMSNPGPLYLSMARVAGLGIPETALGSRSAAIMKAIASNPKTDIDIRLEAAEFAEAAGAMDAGDLIQLYTALTFDDAVRADPIEGASTLSDPKMRALLYLTAIRRKDPALKAQAIAKALRLSGGGGRFGTAARVFAPVIAHMQPARALAWFAPDAIRVLLFSGRNKLADAWLVTLRAAAMFDQNLALGGGMVMPMAAYVNHPLAADWFEKEFSTWWPLVAAKPKIARTVPQMLGLLEANGHPAPNDAWTPILIGAERATVAMPGPAPWFRLREDAEAGRLGETALIGLVAIGPGGPRSADAVVLDRVMSAFRKVGLETEAFDIGLEAMAAMGY